MKLVLQALLLSTASVISGVNAGPLTCFTSGSGSFPTFLAGFSQGFQIDTNAIDTDCFATVFVFEGSIDRIMASTHNLGLDNWATPISRFAEAAVELTNMWTTCKTVNFAKQMSTRMSTLAGVFDMVTTAGMAVVMGMVLNKETPLYRAVMDWIEASSCGKTANAMGRIIQYTINYQVPDEFYAEMLTSNLMDSINF